MTADATRVAVVGTGGMGACHARNIADLAGAEVGWIADPDETAGRTLADAVGAAWTADGFEAISAADAVVIASPDRFHFQYVHAALDRDLATLCEKPLTVDLADAISLVDRESQAGHRRVQLGFMREYDEPHSQVQDALAELGPVHFLRCVHRNTNEVARPLAQMLVESVIHDIHSVRFLSGSEVVSVATTPVERDRKLRFVLLTCGLANGGVATIEFDDAAAGYEVLVEASAELGSVTSSPPVRAVVRKQGALSSEIGQDWFAPFLDTYRLEMRTWLESVAADVATGPSVWDGYAAQAVVAAAVASARSGNTEPVTLIDQPAIYRSAGAPS